MDDETVTFADILLDSGACCVPPNTVEIAEASSHTGLVVDYLVYFVQCFAVDDDAGCGDWFDCAGYETYVGWRFVCFSI